MDKIKKCIITRIDEIITETPYERIKLDEVEVLEPETVNDLGEEFGIRLKCVCRSRGYFFKYYVNSYSEGIDYDLIVE